jgi:hypothetical protein
LTQTTPQLDWRARQGAAADEHDALAFSVPTPSRTNALVVTPVAPDMEQKHSPPPAQRSEEAQLSDVAMEQNSKHNNTDTTANQAQLLLCAAASTVGLCVDLAPRCITLDDTSVPTVCESYLDAALLIERHATPRRARAPNSRKLTRTTIMSAL